MKILSAALVGVAVVPASAPTPDPIIVGPDAVETYIAADHSQLVCDAYEAVTMLIGGLDIDGAEALIDAADALVIVQVEGDLLRLDNEARDSLVDWLHADCAP